MIPPWLFGRFRSWLGREFGNSELSFGICHPPPTLGFDKLRDLARDQILDGLVSLLVKKGHLRVVEGESLGCNCGRLTVPDFDLACSDAVFVAEVVALSNFAVSVADVGQQLVGNVWVDDLEALDLRVAVNRPVLALLQTQVALPRFLDPFPHELTLGQH